MLERELKKNGSAAKDETAFKAMKNAIGAGEVYRCKSGKFLIVNESQNGISFPVLRVVTEVPADIAENPDRWVIIDLGSDARYYSDVSMVAYSWIEIIEAGKLIGVVDDVQMTDIKNRIADSLGIKVTVEQPANQKAIPEGTYEKMYNNLLDKLVSMLKGDTNGRTI